MLTDEERNVQTAGRSERERADCKSDDILVEERAFTVN